MPYYNSAKSVIVHVCTLVLLFASLPPGQARLDPAVLTDLLKVSEMNVTAFIACSATGNPPASGSVVGAAGMIASGSCNGASGNLGMLVTDPFGFISAHLSFANSILFVSSQGTLCDIVVTLPVTGTTCQLMPPTGTLTAPLNLVSLVPNAAGQLLAIVTAGSFVYAP